MAATENLLSKTLNLFRLRFVTKKKKEEQEEEEQEEEKKLLVVF